MKNGYGLIGMVVVFLSSSLFAQVRSGTFRPATQRMGGGGGASATLGKFGVKETSRNTPTETDGTQITKVRFTGPDNGWGIVKTPSTYYSTEGKHLGELPGGVLFSYVAVKPTSKSLVLYGKIKRTEQWEGPFLLDYEGLTIFSGELEKMPPSVVEPLVAYFTVSDRITQRKKAIEEAEYSKNPYYASAKSAMDRYDATRLHADELQAKSEKLKGLSRSKVLDELRALKYEQNKVKMVLDRENANYKIWKESHPIPASKYTMDGELQRLQAEYDQLQVAVRKFLPGK